MPIGAPDASFHFSDFRETTPVATFENINIRGMRTHHSLEG